jgi:hypothetical protein
VEGGWIILRHREYLWIVATAALLAYSAGAGAQTWMQTFAGSGYGALFDAVLTADGSVIAVGATNHVHVPPYEGDVLLMKLSLAGDVLWERTWGGSQFEQAWSVAPAQGGGFYVFGETASFGAGDRDFFILRITDAGEEVWMRTYGSESREWPFGMLALSNGDFLIYGLTSMAASGLDAQYALRVTPDGAVVWEHVLGEDEAQFVAGALETSDGDLVLCVSVGEDGALVKLDASGSVLWSTRYELDGWQYPSDAVQIEDSGFLLAGFYLGAASSNRADVWLARCSSSGELAWEKSFGDRLSDDYALSLLRLADGSSLIGGLGSGMPLWRVDDDGTVLWERRQRSSHICGAFGLLELPDSGFLVSGFLMIVNARSYDAVILRTDAEGRISD